MEYSFKIDNEVGEELEVYVDVQAYAEDDCGYEIVGVFNNATKEEIALDSLGSELRSTMERRASELADSKAYDAWIAYCELQADRLYDSWRDGE